MQGTLPGQRYISGIDFNVSWSSIDSSNPDFINQDMNNWSGGKYIYPNKLWTHDPNQAITAFAFVQGSDEPPAGFIKINQDLN